MIGDEVDDDFDSDIVGGRDKIIKIGKRAERWVDVTVLGNVVAEVCHR